MFGLTRLKTIDGEDIYVMDYPSMPPRNKIDQNLANNLMNSLSELTKK